MVREGIVSPWGEGMKFSHEEQGQLTKAFGFYHLWFL